MAFEIQINSVFSENWNTGFFEVDNRALAIHVSKFKMAVQYVDKFEKRLDSSEN